MKTYFYQQLNGLDQKVYDEIVNGLNQGNLRIAVSSFGSVKKVAVDIFNNYPLNYFHRNQSTFSDKNFEIKMI